MSYVIVIDVCNNRARKAYKQGLNDLALVWDQLMLVAKQKDDIELENYHQEYDAWKEYTDKKAKERADSMEKFNKELKIYEEKLAEYEVTKNNFFGSTQKPRRPTYPYHSFDYMIPQPINPDFAYKKYYESIKAELTDKFNLADAAIGPFRMTEGNVARMIAWEDGSRVQEIVDNSMKKLYSINGITVIGD